MSRIITRCLLTSPLSIFSLRRRPTLLLPRIDYMNRFCLFSSSSGGPPYVHLGRIYFPSHSLGADVRHECDWTPPLRTSCITKDNYILDCCGRRWTRGGRHWLVRMNILGVEVETEQELFNYYIKYLAWFLGSEEEAKKKIYLVSYGCCYGFGAELDFETSIKLDGYLEVLEVYEDVYYHARRRDPNG